MFGVPLRESLRYANVPISTASGSGGVLYIYGYVPVVVAKWCVRPGVFSPLDVSPLLRSPFSSFVRSFIRSGLYLKETATEVEGTFRVNGSAKRMRQLQTEFETPPKVSGRAASWVRIPVWATQPIST